MLHCLKMSNCYRNNRFRTLFSPISPDTRSCSSVYERSEKTVYDWYSKER